MKWFVSFICFLLIVAGVLSETSYAEGKQNLKVAFVRDNDLWIKDGKSGVEKRITKEQFVRNPVWSYDGNWVAYTEGEDEKELWVYHVPTNEMKQVVESMQQFQWSPNDIKIAFLANGVLNVTDISAMDQTKFENVALGVGSFSWNPNGKEFLVSSVANLLPTGWTTVDLFTVALDAKLDPNKMKHLYSLPKQSNEFFAVLTSRFKWSSDGKWIAFLGIPTASISMDMNTLCVLSADGKVFQQLGEMLFFDDWFKWAPLSNRIAFIEGEGRFTVKNKHLMVNEFPVHQGFSFTPEGFVEKGFTWIDGVQIVVSRAKESDWSNDPSERPKPSLYHINTLTKQQTEITKSVEGEGDYMPIYLSNTKKISWVHVDENKAATIYMSNLDGQEKEVLVENIGDGNLYEDSYGWSKMINYFD
ncbi:PD40 domain-containing protein [Anaerobacillus sp. CMMVII]|uniref:translocation protein TolB n=1 Tax=Anaerobacillus sp. CMMVII TaxID=2755588 RepID=UPI0021B6EF27|nr:translocation protein TolB [Anaerobacillus sp. CMMVII]MCT8136995.1 PD40 domain-containing protein [Anaerobacillus sp. CMMVII]